MQLANTSFFRHMDIHILTLPPLRLTCRPLLWQRGHLMVHWLMVCECLTWPLRPKHIWDSPFALRKSLPFNRCPESSTQDFRHLHTANAWLFIMMKLLPNGGTSQLSCLSRNNIYVFGTNGTPCRSAAMLKEHASCGYLCQYVLVKRCSVFMIYACKNCHTSAVNSRARGLQDQ